MTTSTCAHAASSCKDDGHRLSLVSLRGDGHQVCGGPGHDGRLPPLRLCCVGRTSRDYALGGDHSPHHRPSTGRRTSGVYALLGCAYPLWLRRVP